jgi:type II secretory pathway pseudopilin PulG
MNKITKKGQIQSGETVVVIIIVIIMLIIGLVFMAGRKKNSVNEEATTLNELKAKANQLHLIHDLESIDDYKLKQILFNKENKKAKVIGHLEIKIEGSKIKNKIPITFFAELSNDWWELTGLDFEWFN